MERLSRWAGRRWAALGSSVTRFPGYSQPLATMLGVSLTNLAQGGGSASTSATSAPGSVHGQIASIPADTDLVTFEVGSVDFRTNAVLGRLYDTALDTFYGALFRCIADTLAAGPRRTIVFITPFAVSSPNFVGQWDHANENGDRFEDFVHAIGAVCAWCGIQVIRAGQEAGIGGPSFATYTQDGIHLNMAGGLRFASFIHERLLSIAPFPDLPGSLSAGGGSWTMHPVTPADVSGTGITVDHVGSGASDRPIAFTGAGTHIFPVLWLTTGGDNAIDFISVPGAHRGLWFVVGSGPAGWVGVGDFGNLGGQRIATFSAEDGAVSFGGLIDFPYATDANLPGMRWRVRRLGDVVQIYQQRADDMMWVAVAHPIDLAALDVAPDYRSTLRLGILASHGSVRSAASGCHTAI